MKTRVIKLTRDNKKIKLVGVCHIGTKPYYDEIQKELRGTTLYEGVKGFGQEINYLDKLFDIVDLTEVGILNQKKAIDHKQEDWIRVDANKEELLTVDPFCVDGVLGFMKLNTDEIKGLPPKVVLFIFKFLLSKLAYPLVRILSGRNNDYALIEFRNNIVVIASIKMLTKKNSLNLFYGEKHLAGLLSNFKQMGFNIESTKILSPWK